MLSSFISGDSTTTDTKRKTSLSISWLHNTDADLNGYYIYHGPNPSTLTDKYLVGKETNSYVYQIKDADSADHYFAISAVDLAGNESTPSGVIHVNDKITS